MNVRKEDKELFRVVAGLSPEKVNFIRGIVIGLQLQEKEIIGTENRACQYTGMIAR